MSVEPVVTFDVTVTGPVPEDPWPDAPDGVHWGPGVVRLHPDQATIDRWHAHDRYAKTLVRMLHDGTWGLHKAGLLAFELITLRGTPNLRMTFTARVERYYDRSLKRNRPGDAELAVEQALSAWRGEVGYLAIAPTAVRGSVATPGDWPLEVDTITVRWRATERPAGDG